MPLRRNGERSDGDAAAGRDGTRPIKSEPALHSCRKAAGARKQLPDGTASDARRDADGERAGDQRIPDRAVSRPRINSANRDVQVRVLAPNSDSTEAPSL